MIVALAGRRIDADDAEEKNFPLENVAKVKAVLKDFFMVHQPKTLVCSAACGSDLIALEVAGELGIHRIMVLPFLPDVFKKKSVTDRPGNWEEIFNKAYNEMRSREEVIVLHYDTEAPNVYHQTNLAILNKAENLLETTTLVNGENKKIMAVIVWDGKSRKNNDVTAHFLQEAERRNIPLKEIFTQ
jgi:hypothetical protein